MAYNIWMIHTPGQGTLKAELCDEDRRKVWNGTAFVLRSTLTTEQWRDGLITLSEQIMADSTATGFYVGSLPSGLSDGEYLVRAFAGEAPSPSDSSIGEQVIAIADGDEVTNEDLQRHGDIYWASKDICGDGSVIVNHDYVSGTGIVVGSDALRCVDENGVGVDNAVINCYLRADYDANRRTSTYIVARVTTTVDGRWARDMRLDPAEYTLVAYKQGVKKPTVTNIVVVPES